MNREKSVGSVNMAHRKEWSQGEVRLRPGSLGSNGAALPRDQENREEEVRAIHGRGSQRFSQESPPQALYDNSTSAGKGVKRDKDRKGDWLCAPRPLCYLTC